MSRVNGSQRFDAIRFLKIPDAADFWFNSLRIYALQEILKGVWAGVARPNTPCLLRTA